MRQSKKVLRIIKLCLSNSILDKLYSASFLVKGVLEKCVNLFFDGLAAHSQGVSASKTELNENTHPIKQTFAQEIEEKYFQVPSSLTTLRQEEAKPSRRGSLKILQVHTHFCIKICQDYHLKFSVM